MAILELTGNNTLYFEHERPKKGGFTYFFINPLTGNTDTWRGIITQHLLGKGHGYIIFDLRGQGKSQFDTSLDLDTDLIVADIVSLYRHMNPKKTIFVGLSIGGLYAALALGKGLQGVGLVLVNTLRMPSLRLDWINTTMINVAEFGGTALLMDFNLPMLVGDEFLKVMKESALNPTNYKALDQESGIYKLMKGSLSANWNFQWSNVKVPTLIMTGHKDRVFRVEQDIDYLSSTIVNAERVEMPEHGHLIPLEAPELFSERIIEFSENILMA